MTLPVILAYQAANEDEKAFFDAALSGEDDSAPDLSRAIEIIARHNGIGQTIARAQSYADKAREALSGFAQSPIKTALLEAVDFCVARAY
jgi:octaprenyl-diphosphate synthase